MRLIIKPLDSTFDLLLETGQYQRAWQLHSRKIRRAFRDVTGLEFQQNTITAYVQPGSGADAGSPYHPMHLPADYHSEQVKLITLIHELCHRLLGGNALGPVSLGLIPHATVTHPDHPEYEHRHAYLFEYDVIERALGAEFAALCRQQEEQNNIEGPHDRAWAWAMKLSYEQRQRALKLLTKEALPRDRWHELNEREKIPIPHRDPADWFDKLARA